MARGLGANDSLWRVRPLAIKQAVTRGAIVTVGPRGVRDVRISPDWIPWTAIC
jgi:hypothetical protein